MLDFLDRLRQKPEGTRLMIALTTAGTVTLLIALVWGVSFLALLKNKPAVETSGRDGSSQEEIQEGKGGLASFMDLSREAYKNFQARYGSEAASTSQMASSESAFIATTTFATSSESMRVPAGATSSTTTTTATATTSQKKRAPAPSEDGVDVVEI